MSDRRPRKKNFTHEEILILLSKYKLNKGPLESKFNTFVTNKVKQQIWEDITDTINSKGVEHRDVKEVRKKWSDLKMQAVEDFPRNVPTGGGPKPDMGPYSSLVLDIVGEDSPSVIGISCGVESGTAEDAPAPVSPKSLPATALAPTPAPPPPHTAEQPLSPPAETCLLETPQDGSNTHLPPAAKRAKGNRRPPTPSTVENIDTLRCQLFKAEIEKLKQETEKIQAEKEKIELEKIKLNIEIFTLKEDLKTKGYVITLSNEP